MDNFIPRRSAPLKEGRAHPFQHPASSRRRNTSPRVIAIAVGLGITCFLAFLYVSSASVGPSNIGKLNHVYEAVKTSPPIIRTPVQHDPETPAVEEHVSIQPPEELPVPPEPAVVPSLKAEHAQKPTTLDEVQHADLSMGLREDFGDALEHIFAIAPDEMHQRELLRPVGGTGKEKLREVGLRTRAYKTFFEAWERLHVVVGENSTYVQNDVMGYMPTYYKTFSDPPRSFPEALRKYESFRWFLGQLSTLLFPWTSPYFADHMALHSSFHRGGRGIAMTAGDEQAAYLLASIPSFRALGCKLPIEIFYLGDSDLSEDFRSELEAFEGVTTRDLSQLVTDEGWRLAGWAGKPFTILYSSFREVIFVDADALFFHNPEILFEDPDYQKTGALFFRDRLIMPESKKRWLQAVLPKPISKQVRQSRMWTGDSGHMQESGVVVVDKWRHFMSMLLVSRMNGPDRDGNKDDGIIGIYDMVYGDKETFWIGWELAGDTEYSFHQGDAGIMGQLEPAGDQSSSDDEDDEHKHDQDHEHEHEDEHKKKKKRPKAAGHENDVTICAPQLLHLDLAGKPLWFNGWLYHNKFAGREKVGGQFDYYIREPREVLDPGAWQLEEGNVCCLSNDMAYQFSPEERKKLEMMIDFGRKAGSYADGKP